MASHRILLSHDLLQFRKLLGISVLFQYIENSPVLSSRSPIHSCQALTIFLLQTCTTLYQQLCYFLMPISEAQISGVS
jgi:hypothetical protein